MPFANGLSLSLPLWQSFQRTRFVIGSVEGALTSHRKGVIPRPPHGHLYMGLSPAGRHHCCSGPTGRADNSSNRKFFLSLLLLVLKRYSVLHERGGGPAQVPCLDLGFGSHSVQADFWAVSLPPLPSLLSAIGPEFTVYTKAFSREGNYLVGEKAFPSSVVKGCTDHSGAFQCCAIDKDRRIGERTFKCTK